MRILALLLIASVACGDDDSGPAEGPETTETPEPTDPAPQPAEPSEPEEASEAPIHPAVVAYRASVSAFNRGNEEAYLGSMAESLRCFYGSEETTRDMVRGQRWRDDDTRGVLVSARVDVLVEEEGEAEKLVILRDRGYFSREPGSGRQVLHEKLVALTLANATWTIVGETNFGARECIGADIPEDATDEAFTACRTGHNECLGECDCSVMTDECRQCRADCETAALTCLGVHRPARELGPPRRRELRAIERDRDVRRFLAWALRDAQMTWVGETNPNERYLRLARTLGAPRWRINTEAGTRCRGRIVDHLTTATLDEAIAIEGLMCDEEVTRCAAYLKSADARGAEKKLVMHLVFHREPPAEEDGEAGPRTLRVAWTLPHEGAPPEELPDLPAEAAAAGEQACQPALEALVADRVGEDFFVVRDAIFGAAVQGNEEAVFAVRRLCEDDASAAVQALGDDWLCGDRICGPSFMCGNYCEAVGTTDGDSGSVVVQHASGVDVPLLSAGQIARYRESIPCGSEAGLTWEEAYP